MKIFRSLTTIAVCVLLPMTAGAQSQQPTAASEISASGIAEIRLAPDRAVVTTTVETRGKTATVATAANGSAANRVLQELRSAGLPDSAVTTSGFSVQQYFPQRYDPRASQEPDGFITRIAIRAETDHIALVSSLIDAALAGGATRIGVQFSSSRMTDARRGALRIAFTAARTDAVALAQAAGGTLGRLLSVAPNGASMVPYRPSPQGYDMVLTSAIQLRGGVAAAALSPGDVASSVLVTGRWEFLAGSGH